MSRETDRTQYTDPVTAAINDVGNRDLSTTLLIAVAQNREKMALSARTKECKK